MPNRKPLHEIDQEYDVRWLLYYTKEKGERHVEGGRVGHHYANRNSLGRRLRELYDDLDVNSISVIEHRPLSVEEIEALIKEAG